MSTSRIQPQSELPKPSLVMGRDETRKRLEARIQLGKDLLQQEIRNEDDLQGIRSKRNKWHDFNIELLGTLFTNEKFAREYEKKSHVAVFSMGYQTLHQKYEDFVSSVQRKLDSLESIRDRLELIQETSTPKNESTPRKIDRQTDNSIFVVHGHDEAAKSQMSSFLKDIGLNPIILNDQASKGMTVIEKLEHYAKDASFAVILLTPDDVGRARTESKDHGRARQNVILELGYFIHAYGRDGVCALYKKEVELPDVELPSDYNGVVYTPFDSNGGWKLQLAKELKAAGFIIDGNKLL